MPHLRHLRLLTLTLLGILVACGARLASQPQATQQGPAADAHAAIRANNLGAAYMNQQKIEQALEEFAKAYAADPKLTAARLNQGIALLNLQRLEPARAVLREIAEHDPKNVRAWYNLGILEKNAGDAEAALVVFEKAAALDPDDADTHYFLGTLHAEQQRYPEAIAAFERAIARNKFHVSAEFGLARALQRSGNTEQSRLHLARFQHLTTERLGAPMSLAYGDQGRYSLAETVTLPPAAAPPPIPVKFTPVPARTSGLRFVHSGLRSPEVRANSEAATHETAYVSGSGACALDYDNDGLADVFLLNADQTASSALYRNLGSRFVDVSSATGLAFTGGGLVCAAGDYDSDGWTDLALILNQRVLLLRNAQGMFQDVTRAAGIRDDGTVGRLLFLDYDHDGDLDLYVTGNIVWQPGADRASRDTDYVLQHSEYRNVLWRNNGNGSFTDGTELAGLGRTPLSSMAALSDFNNDRAVDLLISDEASAFARRRRGDSAPPVLLLNPREGAFEITRPWPPFGKAETSGSVVIDFDKDGLMDVALAHNRGPAVTLWRNPDGRTFQPVELFYASDETEMATGIAAVDYDNDGWIDLAVVLEHPQDLTGRLLLLRNQGNGRFQDASEDSGLHKVAVSNPRSLFTLDYDGDGDGDVLVTQNGGPAMLLRNDGGNKNNWLKLSLKGLADNTSAIGTKVEVFAGASYQKFEITTPNDLLIGLGQEKQADVVRLLWPTGVVQDEVNLAANQRHVITQIDRRGSSCPILFAWNGERYEFIADAIGPGIVGHWVAPGVRNTSDPTEYIKVPGSLLRERVGPTGERRLSFRFAEPMEEIVYLDQLRLFAIDHPADTEVNPSERFYASGPPFPSGEPVFTHRAHARPPARAWDHRGYDVTALLRDKDRRYVTDFADAPYKGFAELHWIELDLGEAATDTKSRSLASLGMTTESNDARLQSERAQQAAPLRLLLHGYTDYFTATSVYAAHQGGVTAIVPYVEALTPQGAWLRVENDMGFPAGLARTMVVDLTGKLPPGTRRIRIATNLKVYWDQVLIDTTPAGTPHRIIEAPLVSAAADYLGYPLEIRGTPESDIRYDYHTVSATGPYARAAGHYTRYGDVRALVAAADDRFVLLGSGDEVAVEFDAAALPRLPDGWTRDWFFYVDGFAKDMDFYAAHPFTVTPLPYHAMPGYPYPAERGYPATGAHFADQLEMNTRSVSARPAPSYRFRYDSAPEASSQMPR
jgi:tetratricopeptide (TPR) repeat protein